MKIKLIKKYWDDHYEYHITKPAKYIRGNDYDYVAITVNRNLNLPEGPMGSKLGVPSQELHKYYESDEEFEARANKKFEEFIQKEKNKKEDVILKEVII